MFVYSCAFCLHNSREPERVCIKYKAPSFLCECVVFSFSFLSWFSFLFYVNHSRTCANYDHTRAGHNDVAAIVIATLPPPPPPTPPRQLPRREKWQFSRMPVRAFTRKRGRKTKCPARRGNITRKCELRRRRVDIRGALGATATAVNKSYTYYAVELLLLHTHSATSLLYIHRSMHTYRTVHSVL